MNTRNHSKSLNNKTQRNGTLARSVDACRQMAAKFSQLKDQLIRRLVDEVEGWIPANLVQQAVLEAEALARSTPYPLLLLPVLAEEKVRNTPQWISRRQNILQRQETLTGL
ncbi:MAG: hypothetical protein JWR26_1584 [Pedosphaera sp.]|nr:hypothetical protein [Pedosphaera sp.]